MLTLIPTIVTVLTIIKYPDEYNIFLYLTLFFDIIRYIYQKNTALNIIFIFCIVCDISMIENKKYDIYIIYRLIIILLNPLYICIGLTMPFIEFILMDNGGHSKQNIILFCYLYSYYAYFLIPILYKYCKILCKKIYYFIFINFSYKVLPLHNDNNK